MLRCATIALLVLCATLRPASADELASTSELKTDANIITGLDVSSSINAQETVLQINGMAQAICAPEVLAAIQRGRHGRIGFSIFVWADGDYPELISWRMIGSEQDAAAASQEIKARLETILKSTSHNVGSLTDLSAAMEHAATMLSASPYSSKRSIVNIIGNGADNVGEDPSRARSALIERGVTINGVVLGGDPKIINYYRSEVIGGRTPFVMAADNAESIARVFASKFFSEIALHVVPEARPDRL
jgi:hypothetical protein